MNNENNVSKKQRRKFLRYEWFKCKKLGLKWRRPRGLHSKVRQGRKGKPPQVNAGYGRNAALRGMVNGYKPVVVRNVADFERIDRAKQAAVLASGIGAKLIPAMVMKAEQLGVVIMNKEKIATAQHRGRVIEKQRAERARAKTEAAKPVTKTETKAEAKPEIKHEAKPAVASAKPVAEHEAKPAVAKAK